MNWRTLLLDVSGEPIEIIPWEKTMQLLVTGRAEIVELYDGVEIGSIHQESHAKNFPNCYKVRGAFGAFILPSILKMLGRFKRKRGARFSRYNIFLRDEWTCQYCGKLGSTKELTFDHIHPQCKGGVSSWENVVAACLPCNQRKGDLSLAQAGMTLRKIPIRPNWNNHLVIKLKSTDPVSWKDYFYWHTELTAT